jgi:hypothetical protein
MNARAVKQVAKQWVQDNLQAWPGLRAAHLVGSVAAAPDDVPFPAYKDVDMHLIFDDSSDMLVPRGPFLHPIEAEYRGLMIEAGLKPLADYRSPEAVLANPEIADHLLADSTLHDPDGLLAALRPAVQEQFARRRWVQARCEQERIGLSGSLSIAGMAESRMGPAAAIGIAGWASMRLVAELCDATLRPVTTGGRSWLVARQILDSYGRLDLYEERLALFGLARITAWQASAFVKQATEAFDRALPVQRTPMPFGHKFHPHLRPYFVDTCRSLLADGYPAEAAAFAPPYFITSTQIMLADGPEAERQRWAEGEAAWLAEYGWDTAVGRARLLDGLRDLSSRVSALVDDIVARNPEVRD